jgi:ankyrin repeat protein
MELLSRNPSLVNCQAKQPPKKDNGQSPLQVAFKTRNFQMADFLIDSGADVNFIEHATLNEWRAPVIHDAIMATILSSRFFGITGLQNTKEKFDIAFSSLSKLVKAGADVNAIDSYGNTCVMRATMDASQLPLKDANPELIEDLSKVFTLLKDSGANFGASTATRKSVLEQYKNEPAAQFFY